MRFKINWASHIVGSKFTVFALFFFVYEGNFPSASPRGGLHLEERFNGGFFCVTGLGGLYLEGLIHGRAYFRNFTVSPDSGFHKQKFVGFRDQDSLAWSDVVKMSHLP